MYSSNLAASFCEIDGVLFSILQGTKKVIIKKKNLLYLAGMVEQIPTAAFGKTDKSKLRFPFLFKFNFFSQCL